MDAWMDGWGGWDGWMRWVGWMDFQSSDTRFHKASTTVSLLNGAETRQKTYKGPPKPKRVIKFFIR